MSTTAYCIEFCCVEFHYGCYGYHYHGAFVSIKKLNIKINLFFQISVFSFFYRFFILLNTNFNKIEKFNTQIFADFSFFPFHFVYLDVLSCKETKN